MLTIFRTVKCTVRQRSRISCRKYCHSEPGTVRVRFAPSPTGYLHLGGLRTALYNYLFARANKGSFVLRIEDTDQSRLIEGATEQLCADLEWAGIVPDEGPGTYGGPLGPYVQSERLELYCAEVKPLLESGSAYYCFCTERRLEMLRKDALKARQVPRYDNRCRHLTPVQIAEKLAKRDTFCIRFKLDPFTKEFNDLVYGKIVYNVSEQEGDPVIIKSDGFPTYHFAHVVDDHRMQITHVLRGVEWQISTTKHLLLYKAFGWTPPKYGHLPLLVNADGTKLSKRQGNINIDHYRREMGILPRALINYITQSGGGFDRQPLQKLQNYSLHQLQDMFDIGKINVNSSRLDPNLLDECNRLEIKRQLQDPHQASKLFAEVKALVMKEYPDKAATLDLNSEHIASVLEWASTRVTSLQQLVNGDLLFLWVLPRKGDKIELKTDIIDDLLALLEKEDFNKDHLNEVLKEFANEKQLKYAKLMKSLRAILSGLQDGPGVAEMMDILGKPCTLERIRLHRTTK